MSRKVPSRPIPPSSARTSFLRIPRGDWAAITVGDKTEFRSPGGPGVPKLGMLQPPSPVIVYAPPSGFGATELLFTLMALEECWREPLGAISQESLANEGFESIDTFRRYWKDRFNRRRRSWDPTRPVLVFRLRPWADDDEARFGQLLLDRLYLDPLAVARS
jgi:hypothetical protein